MSFLVTLMEAKKKLFSAACFMFLKQQLVKLHT